MSTKVGIIVISGNIDKVLPAFMLANTSSAMGFETGMFFSFYGINVIHKGRKNNLKISLDGATSIALQIPDLQNLSNIELVNKSTEIMGDMLKDNKVPSIDDLINQAISLGVKIYPCQTAMQIFGIKKEDLIDGIENPVGAATFLNYINSADKPIVMNF